MRNGLAALLALLPLAAGAAEPAEFGPGSWAALLHAHAGRPTAVHFWGMTCGPCLVELPRWGALAGRRRDLDMVMVEADPMPAPTKQSAATLARAGLERAEQWVVADPSDDRVRFQVDPDWAGELPMTVLVGRDGTVTRILGAADFAAVDAWAARQ